MKNSLQSPSPYKEPLFLGHVFLQSFVMQIQAHKNLYFCTLFYTKGNVLICTFWHLLFFFFFLRVQSGNYPISTFRMCPHFCFIAALIVLCVWLCQIIIPFPTGGNLDYFQSFVITNSASVNNYEHTEFHKGAIIYISYRNCQIALYKSSTILHFYQQCILVLFHHSLVKDCL